MASRVGPRDALLFFYAGHGARQGSKGYLVLGEGRTDRNNSLIDLAEVATILKASDAHHTLLILDSCFAGVALDPRSGVEAKVGTLPDRSLGVSVNDPLALMFNRRAFQLITAGASRDPVGDVAELSGEYAARKRDQKDYLGHSPFTAVLLQALRGRTGLPDGKLLVSELGHYISSTLAEVKDARQTPRYGALGHGEGDMILIPTGPVVNPRLIAPIYLIEKEYAPLRQAACDGLADWIAREPSDRQPPLTRSAVPHLGYLLEDDDPETRRRAVKAIGSLALNGPEKVPEFALVMEPLARLIGDEWVWEDTRHRAATAVGLLAIFAEASPGLGAALDRFVEDRESDVARTRVEMAGLLRVSPERLLLPRAIQKSLDRPVQPPRSGHVDEAVRALVARLERAYAQSRDVLIGYFQKHNDCRAKLKQAEIYGAARDVMAAKLTAATIINFEGFGREPGEYIGSRVGEAPSLWPGTEEWERARRIVVSPPNAHLLAYAPTGSKPTGRPGLVFSPDGRHLALATGHGPIRLWDLIRPGTPVTLTDGNKDFAQSSLAFSPNGSLIASTGNDGIIRLWDVAGGRIVQALDAATGLGEVMFSTDGRLLLAVEPFDGTVRPFEVRSDRLIPRRPIKHPGHEPRIAPWPAAETIVFLDPFWKKVARIDLRKETSVETTLAESRPELHFDAKSTAMSPDGLNVALASREMFGVWDTTTGQQVGPLREHEGITGLALSPDGRLVATAGTNGTVPLWDRSSDQHLALLSARAAGVPALCFSPDSRLLATTGEDGAVQLWDLGGTLFRLRGHQPFVTGAVFSPDRRTLATCGLDGVVRVWDWPAARIRAVLRTRHRRTRGDGGRPVEPVLPSRSAFAISTERSLLASGGADGMIRLWNTNLGVEIAALTGHRGAVLDLAFSPDGSKLSSVGEDASYRSWDVNGHRQVVEHPLAKPVEKVMLSPDGRTLASVLPDGHVRFLDVVTGAVTGTHEKRYDVEAMAFGPIGPRVFAFAVSDGSVHVLDVDTAREVHSFATGLPRLIGIAISHDLNTVAVVADDDPRIYLFDAAFGTLRAAYKGRTVRVPCLAFSPGSDFLLSADTDGELSFWPGRPVALRWTSYITLGAFQGETLLWQNVGSSGGSAREFNAHAKCCVGTF